MRTGIYGALSLLGGYVVFKKSSPSGVQVIRDYPHKVRQVVTIFATKKKNSYSPLGSGCLVGLSLQWVVLSPIQPKQPRIFFSWLT